jgi:hypothetical protein
MSRPPGPRKQSLRWGQLSSRFASRWLAREGRAGVPGHEDFDLIPTRIADILPRGNAAVQMADDYKGDTVSITLANSKRYSPGPARLPLDVRTWSGAYRFGRLMPALLRAARTRRRISGDLCRSKSYRSRTERSGLIRKAHIAAAMTRTPAVMKNGATQWPFWASAPNTMGESDAPPCPTIFITPETEPL